MLPFRLPRLAAPSAGGEPALDADTLVIENERCYGEAVAERSGYGHLCAGEYPPCRGWLSRQRAWGGAFSERYWFRVDREPTENRPCRYVIRRVARGAAK